MSITLENYLKDTKHTPVKPNDLEVDKFYIIKRKDNITVPDGRPSLVHIGKLIDNARQRSRVRNPVHDIYPHVEEFSYPPPEPYFYIYSFAHKRAPYEIHPANKYRVKEDYRNPNYYEFYKPPFEIKETKDTEKDSMSREKFTILQPPEDTGSSDEKAGGKKRKTKKGKRGKKSKDSRKKSKSKRKNRK